MRRDKAVFIKIATILLAISFFVQALTAFVMIFLRNFVLKWGVFSLLVEIHEYNGFIFVALIVIHIYLNWGWVRINILKKKGIGV